MRLVKRWAEPIPVDMAPMIDVVFQQLIYFMLTSSFVVQNPGIKVALPKAATSQTVSRSNIIISLTKDHVIYWEQEVVTLKELRDKLKKVGDTKKPVLIRADQRAYVSRLIELWDLCRDTGFREVHIATLASE